MLNNNFQPYCYFVDVLPEKVEWTQHKNTSHLSCSYCRVEFETVIQQREHYKLDWHRYNLKQHLLCRQPVTEEEFSNKAGILLQKPLNKFNYIIMLL